MKGEIEAAAFKRLADLIYRSQGHSSVSIGNQPLASLDKYNEVIKDRNSAIQHLKQMDTKIDRRLVKTYTKKEVAQLLWHLVEVVEHYDELPDDDPRKIYIAEILQSEIDKLKG